MVLQSFDQRQGNHKAEINKIRKEHRTSLNVIGLTVIGLFRLENPHVPVRTSAACKQAKEP